MKLTLAISDVPPGEESALASGPTLPDPSTIRDAERIATKYQTARTISARRYEPLSKENPFPKPLKNAMRRLRAPILVEILGERELLHLAHGACEAAGYVSLCDSLPTVGRLKRPATICWRSLKHRRRPIPARPVAVVADGEVSSPVTGNGVGGRNSAFALACVPKIAGKPITVLSAGTDGIDGNSPAAGAVADGETLARAEPPVLTPEEFLRRSDAYNFFARLGDVIITGPTGNNLRDLRILLTA